MQYLKEIFQQIKKITLTILLTLMITIIFPSITWASSLGIDNDHLALCPASNNCVVSQNGDAKHSIEPIVYHVDRDQAKETLLKVLTVVPRTEVVEKTDNYIHALSKSRIFKFIDDVEFYLPADESVIHIRSASRVGESDLGVNRRRMEQIRLALQDLDI
ncbi:DUF1499 domain-containing protein [Okeanomitos corallinicola TIOX110]|uniref:DUF1499 domain-containing protein n=1 Tax=Okeanomitos corallinicola TIOX110 TaxID=3133117 RepID=A0ABZ2UQK2_9CYAN